VSENFLRGFPHEMVLRPSHLRAASAETAMMIPAAAALGRRYHELSMPVAILTGDGDRHVEPARHSLRLHDELPHSTLRLLPGVGHMLHHSAPQAVVDAVNEVEEASTSKVRHSRRTAADYAGLPA
jgi:pimeloyl-ACP methyl ester carboxylesterase